MEFATPHFLGSYLMSGSAQNLRWLVILCTVIFCMECVAMTVVASKRDVKKGHRQARTYVSVLPALLIGAVLIPKYAVAICATLGALIVVAAVVIALLLMNKKKAAKTAEEQIPEEETSEAVTDRTVAVINDETTEQNIVDTAEETAEEAETGSVEEPAEEEPASDETAEDEQLAAEPAEEPAQEPVADETVEEGETVAEEPQDAPAEEAYEEQPAEEPVEERPAEAPVEDGSAAAVVPAEGTEEAEEEGNVDDLTEFMETGDASGRAYDARRKMFVLVRYDRSYTARLIQSDDKTKSYYDEIKGELMSYKGVKSRISWRHENFRIGRERVAKLQFRGKKLCLYLPLDPNDYIDSKYKIEDFSDVAKNKEVPLAYLIKNDLRARYAKELIAVVMARFGAEKLEGEAETFSQDYPYDTLDHLIGRKLIKVLMTNEEYEDAAADMAEESAEQPAEPIEEPIEEPIAEEPVAEDTVEEPVEEEQAVADEPVEEIDDAPIMPEEIVSEVKPETAHKLISDARAERLIKEGTRYADFTRKGFVNVDVLSRNFNAGEVVTLDEMKKRIKSFDDRMTFVKVLARGILDKPLIVEGDDFSIDAAKMILLTGGKVIRTKRK